MVRKTHGLGASGVGSNGRKWFVESPDATLAWMVQSRAVRTCS